MMIVIQKWNVMTRRTIVDTSSCLEPELDNSFSFFSFSFCTEKRTHDGGI